jgi:hypothetical protein
MSDEALKELAEDIKAQGQLEPIVLHEGKILDGNNRYLACREVGFEPKAVNFDGTDPYAFVLSKNSKRRHLKRNELQIAAGKMVELRRADDKKCQVAISPPFNKPSGIKDGSHKSVAEAAKATGQPEHTVREAARLVRENPEAADAVQAGKSTLGAEIKKLRQSKTKRTDDMEKAALRRMRSFMVGLQSFLDSLPTLKTDLLQSRITEEVQLDELRKWEEIMTEAMEAIKTLKSTIRRKK